jgi:2-haloacid dehalogenase
MIEEMDPQVPPIATISRRSASPKYCPTIDAKETSMPNDRRGFLKVAVGSVATGLSVSTPLALAGPSPKFKAIAFDAFTTFDPGPVFKLAEELYPGRGAELSNEWRTRQFEYTWLRTVSKHYVDFWRVTEDALVYASKRLKIDLGGEKRARLMNAYLELRTWPDSVPALRSLNDAGVRLAFLSNFTAKMLDANIKNCGLSDLFEHALSTDRVRAFKPDPIAYRMGIDAFKLEREEILFAAFGAWDAAGAKMFGYPTYWVNRLDLPAEELGVVPDAIGTNLDDLARFVRT